ncbi:adenosylcobinamide-phosphate synthase CbiB [Anaerosacchariphilus polymeriproducens]|uniref:Cobalamin biosynthesis protein CobD n=1 Tax=Anaerosacchariphilus polymeriproducens TaxID=1812858 RepID=A0A371AYA3_9FIRM|nr:adenosylcobinamide-phosphate synthase CbiB [Anaerosacchariphilus polymeriproducens]RDU24543.1 cobalamin biosynthesis protein CobD [Anaerosacchariphilus polymeriproducens]
MFEALLLGFLLDLCIGDPEWLYHPVRMIGKEIIFLEKFLRKVFKHTPTGERIAGGLLVLLIVAVNTLIPVVILFLGYQYHFWLGFAIETIMCYQLVATKSLKTESMKVYKKLKKCDIEGARYAVSRIVGRDTKELSEEGIIKATVETVAENSSDGVIAPLFFMMIGGAGLGFCYKTINTLDSMVGYKNEKYQYFGTAAAKLDDIVNFVPARLAAMLMLVSTFLLELDLIGAVRIFKRDRYNHASPNSAQTESVMAGALQIQLAGDAYYFGKLCKKKTIGDNIRPICNEDIVLSNRLLYVTAMIGILVYAAGYFCLRVIGI